ncbi:MAG: hypothetical protein ACJAZP_003511 [Psychromonas sp.]|jgi:hypothetical protein
MKDKQNYLSYRDITQWVWEIIRLRAASAALSFYNKRILKQTTIITLPL